MADMMDRVATARASGYSDDEIVQKLASSGDMSARIRKAQEAGYSSKDIIDRLVAKVPAASKGPADATQIEKNPEWAKRGKIIYKADQGKDFEGSDQDAARWLKDYVYDFNNRLIGTGTDAGRGTVDIAYNIGDYSPEAKKAFVDAQNDYENMGYSWKGAGEVTKRILTDPTTYLGLGVGKLFSKGAQVAATEGVKELAKRGASQGLKEGAKIGAVEGAVYGGATDTARQAGMINAGGQESFDPLQAAQSAGIGALGGGVIGGAVGAISGGIAGRNPYVQAARQIVDDPEQARINAEITKNLSDIQATRNAPIQLSDVNQATDILRSGVMRDVKATGQVTPDQAQQLSQALVKARGMTNDNLAAVEQLPTGQQVAKQARVIKSMRDMTQPESSDKGFINKAARTLLDYAPVPRVVGDAVKYAFLSPRKSGEQVIADAISPKRLSVAEKVLELAGPSEASQARQTLTDMAKAAAEARKATMDAKQAKDIQMSYTRKQRALEAVQNNDPAVPDSPQGTLESATGFNRSQSAQALRLLERLRPSLKPIISDYRTSVAQGGRVGDLSTLIRAMRKLADDGVVPRANEPNTGTQVMQQGIANYSPAMAQANANQARVTDVQRLISAANVDPSEVQTLKTAVAAIGKTNNREEAKAVFENMLQNIKSPEGMRLAQQEIPALIEQIRHKTPKDAQAARKRQ